MHPAVPREARHRMNEREPQRRLRENTEWRGHAPMETKRIRTRSERAGEAIGEADIDACVQTSVVLAGTVLLTNH